MFRALTYEGEKYVHKKSCRLYTTSPLENEFSLVAKRCSWGVATGNAKFGISDRFKREYR